MEHSGVFGRYRRYRREYEKCLSENLGAGAVGHVTEFDQAVYPKNCSGEQGMV